MTQAGYAANLTTRRSRVGNGGHVPPDRPVRSGTKATEGQGKEGHGHAGARGAHENPSGTDMVEGQ